MAPQVDHLVKVGLEGFALIDEFCGRTGRSRRLPSSQGNQPCVYHGPQVVTVKETVINSHEAVQYYGAAPYIYRGPQVSQMKVAVVDSNEAAQKYCGTAIIDYRKKKSLN